MTQRRNIEHIFAPPDLSAASNERTIPYQSMLRVIGMILDQLGASDIVIVEGFENFTVRFSSGAECEVRELSYADLLEACRTLRNERTLLGTAEQGYYQDLLRALGYELEGVRASNLLFAQAGEQYLLTFQCPEASSSAPRPRYALLTPVDVTKLLERAHGRRGIKPNWGVRRKGQTRRMASGKAISDEVRDRQG